MSLESSISFFVAVLIFSITPGPGVFAILARALTTSATHCIPLALGIILSDLLYLIAACFGLAVVATQWGEVFTVIRIVGAIYLVYLGWKIWTAPLDLTAEPQKLSRSNVAASFLQGFLISASNPKVILFYIAFLPTFMDLEALSSADIALATLLTFIGLMIGLMLIAVFAHRSRRFFQSEAAVKRLNKSAGSIMVAAGAYLASRH